MADPVNQLKQLLFDRESATLVELDQRISKVADAEERARVQIAEHMRAIEQRVAAVTEAESRARTQIAESLAQLEEIRRIGADAERRLAELHRRTGTPEALRSSVAQVIDDVIVEARQTRQEDLSRALAPMLVKTIKAELRNNQAEMVEALYPITGQLVKSYVASAMRDLTNRLNRGLQSNRFMLRVRSLFSGYSMAELSLAETQRLEVEEIYLVRRGSGELLQRFPQNLGRSNSDMHMSGVLAAINDFAANAFQTDGGHLRAFDLDDFKLFLRASPVYLIAAKCRGVPAPGVENLVDQEFLTTVSRLHESEQNAPDVAASQRLLADLKTRIEDGIVATHEQLSNAGLPFNPLRVLTATAVLAVLCTGGWFAWTAWETETTRATARTTIATTDAMSGYPVSLEVGYRGRSVAISGLAPSEVARSELMARLATDLPGVEIADRGLAALPAPAPDMSPVIAEVRRNVTDLERQTIRNAAVRSLDRASRRIADAVPDLAALATLQTRATADMVDRASIAAAVQKRAGEVLATIRLQREVLINAMLEPAREAASSLALAGAAGALRISAGEISGLIGQRGSPAAVAPLQRDGDLSDSAEQVAIAAERFATVSAAALHAASIRIPEPPQIPEPTPRERLVAYARQNAIFFANNDEYRDQARAEAIMTTVVGLAQKTNVLVRVIGYTDERGGQTRNNVLSQQRADKVAQALVERGFPRSRIVAVGRATGPDLSPSTGPDSANRRVEFEIGFDGEPGPAP